MSGKSRLMAKLRSQHWYGLVTAELERLGISEYRFEAPRGKGHPKLIANIMGRELRLAVPSSERGGGDHKYLAKHIERFYRQACEAEGRADQ